MSLRSGISYRCGAVCVVRCVVLHKVVGRCCRLVDGILSAGQGLWFRVPVMCAPSASPPPPLLPLPQQHYCIAVGIKDSEGTGLLRRFGLPRFSQQHHHQHASTPAGAAGGAHTAP